MTSFWKKKESEMYFFSFYLILLHLASLQVSECSKDLLTISPKRRFDRLPKYGENLFFECTAHGKNIQRLMWTGPDGKQINTYNTRIYIEDGSSGHNAIRLMVSNVGKKDIGDYTCSANVDGKEADVSVHLNAYKEIDFSGTMPEQFLEEWRDSTLKCNVDSDPKARVVWNYKKKSISAYGDKIVPHPSNPDWIIVKNASLDDKGIYTCNAYLVTESLSDYDNFDINVKVHHQPMEPVNKPQESYSFVSGVVNLTCESVAEPEANFTWYRGNEVIMPSDTVKIFNGNHSSVLQLTVVNEDMFGDYDCEAQNHLGIMRRVVPLAKGEKPPAPQMTVEDENVDGFRLNLVSTQTSQMPVIGYKVEYKVAGADWETAGVKEFKAGSPYVLDGLKSYTLYAIRSSAKNIAGYSDPTKDILRKTAKEIIDQQAISGAETHNMIAVFFAISFSILSLIFSGCTTSIIPASS